MEGWWFVFLLTAALWSYVEAGCTLCSTKCTDLRTHIVNPANIIRTTTLYVRCKPPVDAHLDLAYFIKNNNFTHVQSFTLIAPSLKYLNLTNIRKIPYINFSWNNLTYFNTSLFSHVTSLNLSHNKLEEFHGKLPNVKKLDLSYNNLKIITFNFVNSTKVTYISLRNNSIHTTNHFTSNTLKYLNLGNNSLQNLNLGRFESLKELDLSNNFIQTINSNISHNLPNLDILNISFNLLQSLNDYTLNLTNLLRLDLKNNKISYLSQKCFYGLNKLKYLNLASNQIQNFSPNTFHYLPGLINLIISKNKALNTQDFSLALASGRLKNVDGSETNQFAIPSSLTRSVLHLELSCNNLHQIESGDLDSYPLLNSLDLSFNNISFIEDDALGRLELLTNINLNENNLAYIPHTLPNNLNYLSLRRNQIKVITNNDFVGLQQLVALDLSFNKIDEINETSFSQLNGLEKLNLSGNPIKILSSSSFVGLKHLKILDLSYLTELNKCEQTLCFPVPEYNNLQEINMANSSNLVRRFISDIAALKTFKQLISLDLANSNLTILKKDLSTYLPRLNRLNLEGNHLNCNDVKKIFTWSYIKELSKCVFLLSEINIKMEHLSKEFSRFTMIIPNTVSPTQESLYTTPSIITKKIISNKTENNSIIMNNTLEFDNSTNEMWFNEEGGIVNAFSAQTPTSHPGLFILLLLPIALVSTCMILNYSRLKRNQRNHKKKSDMDIEISNISSELW